MLQSSMVNNYQIDPYGIVFVIVIILNFFYHKLRIITTMIAEHQGHVYKRFYIDTKLSTFIERRKKN